MYKVKNRLKKYWIKSNKSVKINYDYNFKIKNNKLLNNISKRKININIKKKLKFSIFTKCGYTNNIKKENQDSYFFEKININIYNIYLFGVFDGHGKDGKKISEYVSKYILKNLKKYFLTNYNINNEKFYINLITNIQTKLKTKFFNYNLSGCTACFCILDQSKLFIINIGDSKLIIANKNATFFETKDHKPNNYLEKKRIENCGGNVKRFIDRNGKYGPYRIWNNTFTFPGLAMSRSIGDNLAHNLGVISYPDFYNKKLDYFYNNFILLASDGVWEYINIENLITIINKYLLINSFENINEYIYNYIKNKWLENDTIIDDITFILIKL